MKCERGYCWRSSWSVIPVTRACNLMPSHRVEGLNLSKHVVLLSRATSRKFMLSVDGLQFAPTRDASHVKMGFALTTSPIYWKAPEKRSHLSGCAFSSVFGRDDANHGAGFERPRLVSQARRAFNG
jgi:hypothetical protein